MRFLANVVGGVVVILSVSFGVFGLEKASAQGADKYPSKPITLIVPYEAGTGADIMTRSVADGASKKLGVPIMIVNKPGAVGTIGLNEILAAKPDGYTIGFHGTLDSNKMQGIYPKDHHDVAMIGIFNSDPTVVFLNAKKPWKTLKEMLDYAKQNPEGVRVATSAKGALYWVSTIALQDAAGVKFNILPQPGAGQFAVTQVAGGHADIAVVGFQEGKSLVDAGNLRLIGVMGNSRLAGKYSDAPTLKEVGHNLVYYSYRTIFAPMGTPKLIMDKLQEAFGKVALSQEHKAFSESQSSLAVWLPGEKAVKALDERRDMLHPIFQKHGLLKEAK